MIKLTDEKVENPTKLLLVGDTHQNAAWLAWLTFVAVENGCDGMVQLGDFGTINIGGSRDRFLDAVQASLEASQLHLWWIDGNHDDHEWRARLPVDPTTGFGDERDRIHHIPRGHHWQWNGVHFLGMGGASSIDKARRVAYLDWWPTETISHADADKAIAAGPVDVLLSHDAPLGVDPLCGGHYFGGPDQDGNRKALRAIVERVKPSLLVHGHWHHRYAERLLLDNDWVTHVVGLDCDDTGSNGWDILVLNPPAEAVEA